MSQPQSHTPEGTAEGIGPDSSLPASASSPAGVDLAQIERMLALSPIERVQVLEDWVNGVTELRRLMGEGADLGEIR